MNMTVSPLELCVALGLLHYEVLEDMNEQVDDHTEHGTATGNGDNHVAEEDLDA